MDVHAALVSSNGTGNLNKLCAVRPPIYKVAAMPVDVAVASFCPQLRNSFTK